MSRESRIVDQMDLLNIKDVSTPRQCKNGTVVWQLPIKINYPGNAERFIEVASFKTGYVRNQNCGYSNYQLNKRCEGKPEYFQLSNGDYRKFTTRSCVLIPKEIDRLEYLIAYCLKNYYIKHANFVAEGVYVSKWEHEYKMKVQDAQMLNVVRYDRIKELEGDVHNLENKLATINRISDNG